MPKNLPQTLIKMRLTSDQKSDQPVKREKKNKDPRFAVPKNQPQNMIKMRLISDQKSDQLISQ